MDFLIKIPAKYRKRAYNLFALANLALGIAVVYGIGVDREVVALNLVGAVFGLTASANVDPVEL